MRFRLRRGLGSWLLGLLILLPGARAGLAAEDAAQRPAELPAELPQVRVGMLQFGTAHWELEHIRRSGLDSAQGYQLVLQPLANNSAGLLALTSGSVDLIVSDWIWAGQRTLAGDALRFIPFSRRIGELIVPAASTIESVADLPGKRIGVAGGPDGKSWRLLDAYARDLGIDLTEAATISFAAPPLLNRELAAGRLDAVLTFWHFAARLRAAGYREALGVEQLAAGLGLPEQMPMLGYVTRERWVAAHPASAAGFARSVAEAKRALRDDSPWQALRPLMRVDTDAEFEALREGFQRGIPAPQISAESQQGAASVWSLLAADGSGADVAPLPLAIFRALDASDSP